MTLGNKMQYIENVLSEIIASDTLNTGSLNCISKHHLQRRFLEHKGNFAYLLGSQKFRTSDKHNTACGFANRIERCGLEKRYKMHYWKVILQESGVSACLLSKGSRMFSQQRALER